METIKTTLIKLAKYYDGVAHGAGACYRARIQQAERWDDAFPEAAKRERVKAAWEETRRDTYRAAADEARRLADLANNISLDLPPYPQETNSCAS